MSRDKTAPTLRNLTLPRLIVELPDGKEVHHYLPGKEVSIGRDPTNVIAIADNYVSKFHAKLLIEKTSMTLIDLESANKTYVNDQPISESPVRYRDRIRFGTVLCRVEPPESESKPPQAPKPSAAPVEREPEIVEPRAVSPAQARQATLDSPVPAPAAARRSGPSSRPIRSAGRPTPPPVAEDPMKRLLRIGGLLILVSIALAVLLRVLLVPSEPDADDATAAVDEPSAVTSTESGTDITEAPAAESAAPAPPPLVAPASSASGQDADYYFDEGLAHLDTGRLREARQSFERALELDGSHARASTRLALLEEEIGAKLERHFDNGREAFQFLRYEEAIAEWEMFLMLAPASDSRVQEAKQGIAQAQAKLR